MTLDQMRMLVQIAESGSLLAAAENLHRTQPTVTVAMQKLEAELFVLEQKAMMEMTVVKKQIYLHLLQIMKEFPLSF